MALRTLVVGVTLAYDVCLPSLSNRIFSYDLIGFQRFELTTDKDVTLLGYINSQGELAFLRKLGS